MLVKAPWGATAASHGRSVGSVWEALRYRLGRINGMRGFMRRRSFGALFALSSAAVLALTILSGSASATGLTGAGAQKFCDSPKFIGDPVVCTYAFTNQDDFGNNETTG